MHSSKEQTSEEQGAAQAAAMQEPLAPAVTGEVRKYEPQEIANIRAPRSLSSYIQATKGEGKEVFVIDSRVSDHIGLSDLKKSDDKKAFDGEVLRYVQKIKDGAFQEAYDKGLNEGQEKAVQAALADAKADIAAQLQALAELTSKLSTMVEQGYQEQEKEIIDFCYLLVQKIVFKELEKDPELVKSAIKKILVANEAHRDQITIKVSQKDFDFIQNNSKDMAPEVDLSKSKLVAQEGLSPGDVIVDSPQGSVDATMVTRLERLKKILDNQE